MTALNPVQTVAIRLMEVFRLHRPRLQQGPAPDAAIAMLQKVGIPEPAQRFAVIPTLSGGMRQRVMIAMALACRTGPAHLRRADHGARCDHPGPRS